jgi:uncharacterized protein
VVPPAPTARVNDYAGLLSAEERARLERRLAAGEAATGAQMVIAIFRSLEGESLEDFSIRLAERWRIGRRGLDDGVILLVFVADRRLRLEVGYGLEPVITDLVADALIREVLAPRFREGRYAAGLEAAVAAVYERVGAGASAVRPRRSLPPWPVLGFFAVLAVVGALLAWETLSLGRRQRRRHYTLGRQGWYVPVGPEWRVGGPWSGGGFPGVPGGFPDDGGFAGGGGQFGGGGASGRW